MNDKECSDLLHTLLVKRAWDVKSAIPLSSISFSKEELKELLKKHRVKVSKRKFKNDKIWLTSSGVIMAGANHVVKELDKN